MFPSLTTTWLCGGLHLVTNKTKKTNPMWNMNRTWPITARLMISFCSALLHLLCTLQYFVLVFLRNKVHISQNKCKGGECFIPNWKAHAKLQALLAEKNFIRKSHWDQSCTKPFIQFIYDSKWCNFIVILNFQHKLLTAVHKHYLQEEWVKFAKENPNVLPVSSFNRRK